MKLIEPKTKSFGLKIEHSSVTMSWWHRKIQFHLIELLGEGSQGQVYKALRLDRASGLSQAVAIKILRSRTAVDIWRSEFESLAQMRSPHCVQVLSFERVQGNPALVLELVEGVSVKELVSVGPLSEGVIIEVLAQIQSGLIDLANQGLFHGDLSPHNVLIDQDGHVRLLDFGLANGSGKKLRLTPAFAAPERLQGAPANLASDLFSLGRIDQYLRGLDIDGQCLSSISQIWPEARNPLPHKPDFDRQKELALAVRKAKRLRQLRSVKSTETFEATALSSRFRVARAALTGLVLLAPVFFAGAAQSKWLPNLATLELRTMSWHYFYLDGMPVGYAPLDLHLSASETHSLQWMRAGGRGNRSITLAPNQISRLNDSDFSH